MPGKRSGNAWKAWTRAAQAAARTRNSAGAGNRLGLLQRASKLISLTARKRRALARRARRRTRRGWEQAFALGALTGELAGATDGLGLLAGALLGGLLVVAAQLHLAEDAFPLHLLLQGLQGLIDVIVANENLHA